MKLVLLPTMLAFMAMVHGGYVQEDEALYLENFDSHMAASYAAADDTEFLAECQSPGQVVNRSVTVVSDTGYIKSAELQLQCGESEICVIPSHITFEMTENLRVGALKIEGRLVWTDAIQLQDEIYLCAGYVVTEKGGHFDMNLQEKRAWIYITKNEARHPELATRVFGGRDATIEIVGRKLARTWSLLDKPLEFGDNTMRLLHDPIDMGWRVGDRIGVAPTKQLSKGTGQTFTISDIAADGTITLHTSSFFKHEADFYPTKVEGQGPILMSAEVINLSRNIIITGDDFKHVPCDPTLTSDIEGCMCTKYRTTCTVGLHTIQEYEGSLQISNTRIEKCGQRGIMGKYCMHFHELNDCPDCLLEGNVIETSHARGIVVHATHRSVVQDNVLWNVRGAGIYVENGNEMYNSIKYNVVICPFALAGPHHGCTVPGTQNDQSDTALNQAAFYLKSSTNDVIGNRAANTFNGMFNEPGAEGDARDNVCYRYTEIGRWEGNTFHGHGRFGTYPIHSFPLVTDRELATNGFNIDQTLCEGFDEEGYTRGQPSAIVNNVDYDNAFVGQYNVGDIQYKGHVSISNLNLIYWKESKNFEDGCSAHISGSHYAHGNLALPDQATFIIEDSFLKDVTLEANHHCQVGETGFLCMPQYIFQGVTWNQTERDGEMWIQFQKHGTAHGGIFSLSPDDSPSQEDGSPFPDGYISLVSSHFDYLLSAPNDLCVSSVDLDLGVRFDNGILCKAPLRALKVFSRGMMDDGSAPLLKVDVWFNNPNGVASHENLSPSTTQLLPFHQIGDNGSTDKQGYSLPVIPSTDVSYKLSLASGDGNFPKDWVIEFNDPVIGNRWEVEYLQLQVQGRSCGEDGIVSSQHDRRFLYGGSEFFMGGDARGNHGACVAGGAMEASASSSRQPASNAIDSLEDTRWESDSSDPQWLAVDVGISIPLSTVELIWESAFGEVYDIDVSDDGEIWTTAFSETNGVGGTDVIDLTGFSGRYIRMVGLVRGSEYGYSLFEIKVSEPPQSWEPPQPPDMPAANCDDSLAHGGSLVANECPELCPTSCDGTNSYCDCRMATCQCKAGFTGDDCSIDLCGGCQSRGSCAALYLGEAPLFVTSEEHECICEGGWTSYRCYGDPWADDEFLPDPWAPDEPDGERSSSALSIFSSAFSILCSLALASVLGG